MQRHMTTGPVEYIIVGFPGNKFTGEIAPELIALVESGTVRILDLIFIGKDDDGKCSAFEIDELDEGRLRRPRRRVRGPDQPGGHRVRRRSARAQLVGRPAHLGGSVGGAVRRRRPAIRAACCWKAPAFPTI